MANQTFYRSDSLNAQWNDLSQSISNLLIEHEGNNKPEVVSVEENRPITTEHWVNHSTRTHCVQPECAKRFTLTERKHHCRRCGEVYCGICSQFRRRLSVDAIPCCDGILYRVCKKCFDVGPQTLGRVRSKYNEFKSYKDKFKSGNNNHKRQTELPKRPRLDYEEECLRLVNGFTKKCGTSKVKSFVMETFGAVKIPDWQKSKTWIEKSEECLLCCKKFSFTELKSHCRVCGKVICSLCSSDTLIVYSCEQSNTVKWCLINIIGSPDQEPSICLYLKTCNHCHGELAEIQGHRAVISEQMDVDGPSFLDEVSNTNQTLVGVQKKITELLPNFEQLVDAVEAKGDLTSVISKGGSATQSLAKYSTDLSDLFTKFAVVMQSLKRSKPRTNTQVKLAKNLTSSKLFFYNDNFLVYRVCKKRLEEFLSPEILELVQKIVDEQAINNAYIVVMQLGLEALMLSSAQNIGNEIPTLLAGCETICSEDLQKQLKHNKCDWDDHNQTIKKLLQIQLKEHRLVKPSRRCTKNGGAKYVEWFLLDRSVLLLSQTLRQLYGKTAERTFKSSKDILEDVKLQIIALRNQVYCK